MSQNRDRALLGFARLDDKSIHVVAAILWRNRAEHQRWLPMQAFQEIAETIVAALAAGEFFGDDFGVLCQWCGKETTKPFIENRNDLARRLFDLGEDVPQEWLESHIDPIGSWTDAKQYADGLLTAIARLKEVQSGRWCRPHGYPQPYEDSQMCLRRFISIDHSLPDLGDCLFVDVLIVPRRVL